MQNVQFNIELKKFDEDQQMVYGYATKPNLDSHGEIVSLEAIKAALPEYMRFPTIREMHEAKAVGVTKDAKIDADGLWIGAKIVDSEAWNKVKEGVYRAFSIGGIIKRMTANVIDDLELTEISLVDRPANPQAVISVFKSDAKKVDEQEVDEVYKKYRTTVNMSASELRAWSKTDCSKKASQDRSPIERNIKLLETPKSQWGASEVRQANRTISFVSRMRGVEDGEPAEKGCPSKKVISLKNWGYDPGKKNYQSEYLSMLAKYKVTNKKAIMSELKKQQEAEKELKENEVVEKQEDQDAEVETTETEVAVEDQETVENEDVAEATEKLEDKNQVSDEQQSVLLQKFDDQGAVLAKMSGVLDQLASRVEKLEAQPSQPVTKASYVVEKSEVQDDQATEAELEKVNKRLDELSKIRENNVKQYQELGLTSEALELLNKRQKLVSTKQ